MAHRLDGAQLEPQVPQLRLVGQDVVLEVADFLLEVEDARRGGFGAVDQEGVEVLRLLEGLVLACWEEEGRGGLRLTPLFGPAVF